MSNLNKIIHVNEQARAILRDLLSEFSAEDLHETARRHFNATMILQARGETEGALTYCLASAKLLEMLEEKQRGG